MTSSIFKLNIGVCSTDWSAFKMHWGAGTVAWQIKSLAVKPAPHMDTVFFVPAAPRLTHLPAGKNTSKWPNFHPRERSGPISHLLALAWTSS